MATSIKTIKNHLTDDTIYPVTKANAVYLSDEVTTVEGLLGDTSITSIGDGTVTGAISALNSNLINQNFIVESYTITTNTQYSGQYYADVVTSVDLSKYIPISFSVYTSTSNRPVLSIMYSGNNKFRVYTSVNNTTVSFRVFFKKD